MHPAVSLLDWREMPHHDSICGPVASGSFSNIRCNLNSFQHFSRATRAFPVGTKRGSCEHRLELMKAFTLGSLKQDV